MAGAVCSYLTMKGGVGKTTLAANVTRSIADLKAMRILLVDADTQCNLSQLFVSEAFLDKEGQRTFYDAFGAHKLYEPADLAFRLYENKENGSSIDFVQGSFEAFGLNARATPNVRNRAEQAFQQFIKKARATYGLVVLDTNPSATFTTLQALAASDFVVSPITNDVFSMRGIHQIVNEMRQVHPWLFDPRRVVIVRNRIKSITTERDRAMFEDAEQRMRVRFPDLATSIFAGYVRASLLFSSEERQKGFVADATGPGSYHKGALLDDLDAVAKHIIATVLQLGRHAPTDETSPGRSPKTPIWERFFGRDTGHPDAR